MERIAEKIREYHGEFGEHHRYRSWEHCYRFFHETSRDQLIANLDYACLQLGFYLASWGMYRGSSFLHKYAYTIHRDVIQQLTDSRFSVLWSTDFGLVADHAQLIPLIIEAGAAIRETYRPFVKAVHSHDASDTLVTKVLLGTFGCLPAYDRYFIDGLKLEGLKPSTPSANGIRTLLSFCQTNLSVLQEEQIRIETAERIRYPLMKLIDMYFLQIGFKSE